MTNFFSRQKLENMGDLQRWAGVLCGFLVEEPFMPYELEYPLNNTLRRNENDSFILAL